MNIRNIESFVEWLQKNATKSFNNRKELLKGIVTENYWHLTIIGPSWKIKQVKQRYRLNKKLSNQIGKWLRVKYLKHTNLDWDPEGIEKAWNELKLCPELKFLKELWDKGWIKVEAAFREKVGNESYLAYIKFFIGTYEIQLERFNLADFHHPMDDFEKFYKENKKHLRAEESLEKLRAQYLRRLFFKFTERW